MRIWFMSDLHVDINQKHAPFSLPDPRPEHDVVAVVGDVCHKVYRAIQWIADNKLNTKPVLFVPGNHEYYNDTIDAGLLKARDVAKEAGNISVMDQDIVVLNGIRFLGTTLWTDYELYGRPKDAMEAAQFGMNDHKYIRVASVEYKKFMPADAACFHKWSKDWLQACLETPFDGPTIVLTHHAPSGKAISPMFAGDDLSPAFASNLECLIPKANLWLHGHTHHNNNYKIGDDPKTGSVVVNQRGYVHHGESESFDPNLIIEVSK